MSTWKTQAFLAVPYGTRSLLRVSWLWDDYPVWMSDRPSRPECSVCDACVGSNAGETLYSGIPSFSRCTR